MTNVISLKIPTALEAEKIIKELTAQGKISWTTHCKQRMLERSITTTQILNCLQKGRVTENPFCVHNGYETRIEKGTAGDWLRVVVCIKFNQSLLVITAIN